MTGIAWIATAEAVALVLIAAVLAVRGWRGAKRHYAAVAALAKLPPPPPQPDRAEVKALKEVLQAATLASDHGATTLESLAQAVLGAGYRKQQGEIEAVRRAGHRAWDIHHGQRGEAL